MKLGVFLAYSPWLPIDEQVELAVLADEVGLDSVWISEAYGYDAVSILGLIAGKTHQIALGSGLLQLPARKPTTTAMSAAALDKMSGGRFRLGLGASGPQVSEGWYGVPFGRGLARTREYVNTVRASLAGEPVQLDLEPGLSTGLGKPIRMLGGAHDRDIPIYLGALAPKAIEQCFEFADGWLPFVVEKQMLSEHALPTDRPFDVAATLPVAVAGSVEAARDAVRPWLTFYFGAMGHSKKHFLVELAERYGHGHSARDVYRKYSAGDKHGAAAALTPELIDAASIATTPDQLHRRLLEYKSAGATSLVAVVSGDRRALIEQLGSLGRDI